MKLFKSTNLKKARGEATFDNGSQQIAGSNRGAHRICTDFLENASCQDFDSLKKVKYVFKIRQ